MTLIKTKKIISKSERLLPSNTPVNNFHSGVHELLMSLKTWASGEVPRANNT